MGSSYLFHKTISNDYLGLVKTIKAKSLWELEVKERQTKEAWKKREQVARERGRILDLKAEAEFMNAEAVELINEYSNLIIHALEVNDKLDWDSQLKTDKYKEFVFKQNEPNLALIQQSLRVPKKSFFESIFSSLKKKREELEIKAETQYKEEKSKYDAEKDTAFMKYQTQKEKFDKEQEDHNNSVRTWKKDFENAVPEAIEKYIDVVLGNSEYPEDFNNEYEVQYEPNSKALIVSYVLPNTDQIPKISGHKYVASAKEIRPIEMKVKEFNSFYDNIIFQVCLRTIHEVFEAMYEPFIDLVIFNGWVKGVDKATGQDFTSCIISVQVSKDEFENINLEKVEPKACIKQLKGLIAGPLVDLAPVKPILDINKNDKRFIESKEVLAGINSIENLATMDWADFEHLVRELFEKMFTEDGAEVKVTQASRDGGVDAIAFDPDPIKGGKFVIQAKRYNNVVPVSAVRDLYGTVINEGASKGILVTTSHYGKDSRDFVKDKPITLIDGSNLVFMFQKYGYNVRIETK
ncbi:MAG TPA: restriction endonuclease [Patescibacteria group bacterium]|nr:restriction endonuclease [Patescibacteria group bacterium]